MRTATTSPPTTPRGPARYDEWTAWTAQHGLVWEGVGLDIEPDARVYQQTIDNPWGLPALLLPRLRDRERPRRARVAYEALVTRTHAVCVPHDRIWRKPTTLTFEQAAAVPVAGMAALQGLRDKGKVGPGRRVLINGASGGVGSFAVQIAKALGAEVTGVCSTRNVDLVRSLGADYVVDYTHADYTHADFTQGQARFDAILDLVGSRPLSACRRVLAPGGVYVSSVGRLGWVVKVAVASLLTRQIILFSASQTQQDLAVLKEMLESGQVKPVIDRRYTLAEVPDALRYQGQGHARGKSVIAV